METPKKTHAYDIKRIDMKDPEYISETPEHATKTSQASRARFFSLADRAAAKPTC